MGYSIGVHPTTWKLDHGSGSAAYEYEAAAGLSSRGSVVVDDDRFGSTRLLDDRNAVGYSECSKPHVVVGLRVTCRRLQ